MKQLKIKLMERVLSAELTAHLGYEDGNNAPPDQANRRNGTASKRIMGKDGEVSISVPRDRNGSFDPAIRKINFTTNAIESLNRVIRKSIKTRGSFPTEESAMKLIYLVVRNFEEGGSNIREWFAARNQFAIMFEDRFNA